MNILVLTNIYPAPDLEKENTPIVHYFVREWVKMGNNVRVIHYPANFPKIYMMGASVFKKRISSKLGVPVRTVQTDEREYELEDVKIKRIPLLKYKLHGAFSETQINKAYSITLRYLENECFIPDRIVSHWVNPQLEIMARLKSHYHVPTCYIAHTPYSEFKSIYDEERSRSLIDNIDKIGFRSQYIKDVFLRCFGYKGPTFQCYSGIPKQYISKTSINRKFDNLECNLRFIFVGTLIKRKYPAEIVPSVVKACGQEKFEINYIGSGAEEKSIRRYAASYGVADKVNLLGRKDRDEVIQYLRTSDIFVMNSRSEAFGLVYLEAMAQGCITIASRREGFDGIIIDGENGFLCNAGDIDDLAATIKRIRSLPINKLKEISNKAVETAQYLTDVNTATIYLRELESITRSN